MNEKSFIKSRLALKQMTMNELAEMMTKISGKKYTRDSLNGKFYRGTLSINEMHLIAEILDFSIDYKIL